MLDVRSANLMDLAAGLPLEADRTDMRYQWITRLLGNPLVLSDEIMEPFAREVLEQAAGETKPVVLILDQSKLSDRHQVLMLAVRYGDRALPLAWRVETTEGAIGFATQKALLEAVAPWMPAGTRVQLMGDRFYGTADLIGWCQERDCGTLAHGGERDRSRPAFLLFQATRTDSGRPRLSIRLSALTAIWVSTCWAGPAWERKVSPITRLYRLMAASALALWL